MENVDPVFSSLAPAHATVTSAARPVLSGDVADADSGVQQDPSGRETIKFVVRATELDGTTVLKGPETLSPADTGTVSQAGSVFSVTQRVTATLVSSEDIYLIQWGLIAEDVAGNLAVSDEDNLTACDPNVFTVDTGGTAFAACDPFEIRIDSQAPAAVPGVTLWGLVALAGGFGVLVAWRMRHRQTQS